MRTTWDQEMIHGFQNFFFCSYQRNQNCSTLDLHIFSPWTRSLCLKTCPLSCPSSLIPSSPPPHVILLIQSVLLRYVSHTPPSQRKQSHNLWIYCYLLFVDLGSIVLTTKTYDHFMAICQTLHYPVPMDIPHPTQTHCVDCWFWCLVHECPTFCYKD